MKTKPSVLGILGGLGPMATVYFYEMLTRHTLVSCDQEHIDIIINSRSSTPDRTAFILGKSNKNPFDIMSADAKRLVTFGADVLAIPCNTAHYFYDSLNSEIDVPILNMIEETVLFAQKRCKKVGILATSGTIDTNTYQRVCDEHSLEYAVPNAEQQADIMSVIYDDIKKGKPADMNKFNNVVNALKADGCERMILGCTELSLIKRDEKLSSFYIDSMEVLAKNAIEMFGRTAIGFDD
ncbi:MAG: aspartate/glutamate racemase family protein [Clostridia bacterium]|jgi:aspartate racemase|nr:aspartate/glutamate racemase family protein [Clostridia bacterium]NLS85316.1 amino acid racemase [Oscillospiraceae bacterium]